MISIQRLLGKEDKFFSLLEQSADEGRVSVQALVKLSRTLDQPGLLEEFIEARRKDKQIKAQITEAVYTTFVTALEREDIELLANALFKLPKTMEKFAERVWLTPQYVAGVDFTSQASLLEQSADTVLEMIKTMRRGGLDKIKTLNDRLQRIEGEADKLMLALYRDLFSGRHDPVKVIVIKDLYELLEKGIDRCRDTGNLICNIVLKNS